MVLYLLGQGSDPNKAPMVINNLAGFSFFPPSGTSGTTAVNPSNVAPLLSASTSPQRARQDFDGGSAKPDGSATGGRDNTGIISTATLTS